MLVYLASFTTILFSDFNSFHEGIEGLSVTISGGNIVIVANDDAINAAGGESAEVGGQMQRPQGGMQDGMDEPKLEVTEGAFVRITGGTLDLQGRTDGIDSNGHIYLEGGTVKINGQSSGGECALEQEGDFIVTGGELITAGTIYTPATTSTQPIILLSYTSQQASGSVISIKDSAGKVLLEYTSKIAFSNSGFTSLSFKTGKTYTLFINGEKRTDITLSDLTTKIGDDGGAYSTGKGGEPGGGMGGSFPGRR